MMSNANDKYALILKKLKREWKLKRSGLRNCKHDWSAWGYSGNKHTCDKCGAIEVWNMEGWQRVLLSSVKSGWFYVDDGILMQVTS